MRPVFAFLLVTPLFVACGGASAPIPTTYSGLSEQVFVPSCASTNGCHTATSPQDGLDLTTAKGFASMVGKTVSDPNFAGTTWDGWPIVDPGHPEHSALMIVLEQPRPAGLPAVLEMPSGAVLSPDKIAAIRTWIANGAKND